MTASQEAVGSVGLTPGAALAAAREAAGLTQADVAGQMRISLRQVEAIEADRYDALPGAVFVRGFVRNYARLLNLDPVPLLTSLEPALGGDVPLRPQHFEGAMPDSRRSRARVWFALFLGLLAVVLGAAGYEYWRGRSAGEPAPQLPKDSQRGSAPAAPQSAPPTSGAPAVAEPVPLTPERVPDAAGAAAAPAPVEAGATPASPRTQVPGPSPGVASARLEIAFLRESWLEVRQKDGSVVFSGTGAADSTRVLEAVPPVEVVVGNASGVRITYNREPVDVEARATRNIARFTLE